MIGGRVRFAYFRSCMRIKMIDERLVRLKVYSNNIHRYRRLLKGKLTEQERQFVERRLRDEKLAMQSLTADSLPLDDSRAT